MMTTSCASDYLFRGPETDKSNVRSTVCAQSFHRFRITKSRLSNEYRQLYIGVAGMTDCSYTDGTMSACMCVRSVTGVNRYVN